MLKDVENVLTSRVFGQTFYRRVSCEKHGTVERFSPSYLGAETFYRCVGRVICVGRAWRRVISEKTLR